MQKCKKINLSSKGFNINIINKLLLTIINEFSNTLMNSINFNKNYTFYQLNFSFINYEHKFKFVFFLEIIKKNFSLKNILLPFESLITIKYL